MTPRPCFRRRSPSILRCLPVPPRWGTERGGKLSTNTLWSRIATMHLGGNREFSTFRLTLAAVLRQAGESTDDEVALTAWMGGT
jgi:hypothetical protein